MIISSARLTRWSAGIAAAVLGALLSAAAADAWTIPGRVVTLEANDKSNHELLMEVRQDVKEILRKTESK